MQVRQRVRHFDRHRYDVEFRIDSLGVMTRDFRLGDERVHDASLVALPGVSGSWKQRPASPPQHAGAFESGKGSNDRGCVAGHHAGRIATDSTLVVTLSYQRVADNKLTILVSGPGEDGQEQVLTYSLTRR